MLISEISKISACAYLQNKLFCSRISACAYSRTKFIFTDKICLKIAVFWQINYFKNILYVKFNFESIGDNFEAAGFLFSRINAVFIKFCWFFANISKNNNPVASK